MRSFHLMILILFAFGSPLFAEDAKPKPDEGSDLDIMTVTGRLNAAQLHISPDLGASTYTIDSGRIEAQAGGTNTGFQNVILRAPGVAQDTAVNGDLHVRGEHGNLQYRINDILLPEGISGFGLELDPRFVDSLRLITGSLPAQYGFRTSGIIDIHTKTGAFQNGGEVDMYGGSHDTTRPSFEYGGADGRWNYYFDGSYLHSNLGIENHFDDSNAIHDDTDQEKFFGYGSYIIGPTARLTMMFGASNGDYEVPNTPGLIGPFLGAPGLPAMFDSKQLDETQNEQNYYFIANYQRSEGDWDLSVSAFGRISGTHFYPDVIGDLVFNGVASDVRKYVYGEGLQVDSSIKLGSGHTLRCGLNLLHEELYSDSVITAFPADAMGNPTGPSFDTIQDATTNAVFAGVYAQDEWKVLSNLTVNYGLRIDNYSSTNDTENQVSPRLNLVWLPVEKLTFHAGYARYFTPPEISFVPASSVSAFDGTTNQAFTDTDTSPKCERSHYFDVGVAQEFVKGLTTGVDAYYKHDHNGIDDGLFGGTLLLSTFNYEVAMKRGIEFSNSYTNGGFNVYGNIAIGTARGKEWASSQFLFDPGDFQFVKHHWIHQDHDQGLTGAFGTSYTWTSASGDKSLVFVDALYEGGLRTDGFAADGSKIPNGDHLPAYYTVNVGAEHDFKVGERRFVKTRVDVVNVTDNSYEIRNGSGVGVGAVQFGDRIGVFGTVGIEF